MTPVRPTYDDTFSLELLHDYLAQLVCQGYLDDFHGEKEVDIDGAFHVFATRCNRLKEQLFLFAVVDGQYNKLMDLLDEQLEERPADARLLEVKNEWERLHEKLEGKELSDEVMETSLPYRYARMSQAAKSWRFRNELHEWQKTYGALRPAEQMSEEERQQAKKYRGKYYTYPKKGSRHLMRKNATEK